MHVIGIHCVCVCMSCKQRNISGTQYSTVLCNEVIKYIVHLAGILWGAPTAVVGEWVLVFVSVCFILVIATD